MADRDDHSITNVGGREGISRLQSGKPNGLQNSHTFVADRRIQSSMGGRAGLASAVVLARLRIGHTRLTHTYIVKNERPPRCDLCDKQLTVKHILIECNHLTLTRN